MSVRRLSLLAVMVAIAVGSPATATAADVNFYSAVNQFMCVSCHEPLAQVNSPQAMSEKATLRGLIKRGLTLAQVERGMEAVYGQQVLARPAASGFGLTIYILPPAILLAGLALLAFTLPKWRERARRAAARKPVTGAPLSVQDARRLDDELQRFV